MQGEVVGSDSVNSFSVTVTQIILLLIALE